MSSKSLTYLTISHNRFIMVVQEVENVSNTIR
jgi:hypothetical protein